MSTEPSTKPLSEQPSGYILAAVGGLLGGPIGIFLSPLVLLLLNKSMKNNGEKKPNRFRAWALSGLVGAPVSLMVFGALAPTPAPNTASQGTQQAQPSSSTARATAPSDPPQAEKSEEELAAENARIDKQVEAAISENGPKKTEPAPTGGFERQIKERYEVTMTESEAYNEICSAAKEYRTTSATNVQMREEVRAYADYLAPKTGNPSIRSQLSQHGINCLY